MSTQSSDWGMAPVGVGHENEATTHAPRPDDPGASPIDEAVESRLHAGPHPTYDDDGTPVGSADADEDARRAGGKR